MAKNISAIESWNKSDLLLLTMFIESVWLLNLADLQRTKMQFYK